MAWAHADTDNTYGEWGWWQGERVNRRTHDALLAAVKLVPVWGSLRIQQGGLRDGATEASAATHDGLDVGDVAIDGDRTRSQVFDLCTAIMKCGGIPFPR